MDAGAQLVVVVPNVRREDVDHWHWSLVAVSFKRMELEALICLGFPLKALVEDNDNKTGQQLFAKRWPTPG
jgi:hypothetical protein